MRILPAVMDELSKAIETGIGKAFSGIPLAVLLLFKHTNVIYL